MKEAIQKAIEGGWKMKPGSFVEGRGAFWNESGKGITDLIIWQQTTSDPLFWHALGNQQKWFEHAPQPGVNHSWWITVWHRFIDHLAEGKDAESFFTNLLNTN